MKTKLVAALFALAAVSACLLGADVAAEVVDQTQAASETTPAFDWKQLVIAPLVMAAFSILRGVMPHIKGSWVIVGAPLLGWALDMLANQVGAWDTSGAIGAIIGANAVYLHQYGKQTGIIPKNPPAT